MTPSENASDDYYEDGSYNDYYEGEVISVDPPSKWELIAISDPRVYSMATDFKNQINATHVSPRTFESEVQYNDDYTKAVVVTEIEYWFGGGNPAGSVLAYVAIDCNTKSIIESGIE